MPSSRPYDEVMIEHYRAHPEYARELLQEAIHNWSYEELSPMLARIAYAFPSEAEAPAALDADGFESASPQSLASLFARAGLELTITPVRQDSRSEVAPSPPVMESQAA